MQPVKIRFQSLDELLDFSIGVYPSLLLINKAELTLEGNLSDGQLQKATKEFHGSIENYSLSISPVYAASSNNKFSQ